MRTSSAVLFMTYLAAALAALLCPENSWASKNPTYIVTNDDVAKAKGNTVTFYLPGLHGSAPTLTQKVVVATKGTGVGGGGFATTQINVLHDPSQNCVYVADGGSNDIAGIKISTRELAGNFKGSKNDLGAPYGVALAMNDNYLYAGFTGSGTIATFQVLPGCTLGFVGDTYLIGMNGGSLNGMALNGNILVVTYGDGSIESFNIASGMPAPNGDLQDSTGYGDDNLPVAVDISKYGHFAIFGDASTSAVVEVSDISSGRLTPTVAYNLGAGDSSDVRLSPDQHLLYIANNISFKVTAAFFDDATGVVSAGCTSSVLHGAKNSWYVAGLSTLYTLGTGSVLYVAEGGGQSSYIGILQVESSGGQCTLTESSQSPVIDKHSSGLMSIGTFLPRPF